MDWIKLRRRLLHKLGIYKILENSLSTSLSVLGFLSIIVLGLSLPYYLYDFDGFYPQVLAEAHGMLFDIAIIGILIFWLNKRGETRHQIRTYLDEIDDFRRWVSEEAAFRTAGNIKRLNRHNISELNLAESHLVRTNLNDVILSHSNLNLANFSYAHLIGADLAQCRMNQSIFHQAHLNRASMSECYASGADFSKSFLIGADFSKSFLIKSNFEEAALMEADFSNCELSEANFKNANLLKANFSGATGLTPQQLTEAQNLHLAKIDKPLWKLICELNPAWADR